MKIWLRVYKMKHHPENRYEWVDSGETLPNFVDDVIPRKNDVVYFENVKFHCLEVSWHYYRVSLDDYVNVILIPYDEYLKIN